MTVHAACPLCAGHLSVPAHDVLLHLADDGPATWAATCPRCGVLAVLPADADDVGVLLRDARCTTGPSAPWQDDDLGHDAVCVASGRRPEHDVHAPPLSPDEVERLVASLDGLLDA